MCYDWVLENMTDAVKIGVNSGKPVKTMAEFLGLGEDFFTIPPAVPTKQAPIGLPAEIVEEEAPQPQVQAEEVVVVAKAPPAWRRILRKDAVRYPLVFLAAFAFFYVALNFATLTKQIRQAFAPGPAPSRVNAAVEAEAGDYKSWLTKYFVHENAPQILDKNEDPDKDGLTNGEEFLVKTNPFKPDTDEDNFADGREIVSEYNPLYDGKLQPWQRQVAAQYFDEQAIASRLNFEAVAGTSTGPPQSAAPAGFVLDFSKPGRIVIPKLEVNAPVIWSKKAGDLDEDLKRGAVHHPLTAFPGEVGTASIHGHSSGLPWDGDYKTVFATINFLEPGDEILVTVTGTTGQERTYRFKVSSKGVFGKSDPAQFAPASTESKYNLNISTSWPVGTARQRYVVKSELVGF